MDWSPILSRKKRESKTIERNISSGVLLRTFEDHQLESLGDIAAIFRRLERALGYRTMRFQEYISGGGVSDGIHALHLISELKRWCEECERWRLDTDTVVYLARDNLPISRIVQIMGYPRVRVLLHQQCCLTVWSIHKKRCGADELRLNMARMDRNDLGLQ